jgi:hypothetical protein
MSRILALAGTVVLVAVWSGIPAQADNNNNNNNNKRPWNQGNQGQYVPPPNYIPTIPARPAVTRPKPANTGQPAGTSRTGNNNTGNNGVNYSGGTGLQWYGQRPPATIPAPRRPPKPTASTNVPAAAAASNTNQSSSAVGSSSRYNRRYRPRYDGYPYGNPYDYGYNPQLRGYLYQYYNPYTGSVGYSYMPVGSPLYSGYGSGYSPYYGSGYGGYSPEWSNPYLSYYSNPMFYMPYQPAIFVSADQLYGLGPIKRLMGLQ